MDREKSNAGQQDRDYWIALMSRIAEPVLGALARQQLKATMPVEAREPERATFTHLEAISRLLAGIAPWLETPHLDAQEEALRQRYAHLARLALDAATDPRSPDYCTFSSSFQPIVDAAFLAQALLRAPVELYAKLDQRVRRQVLEALKLTRTRKPFANNWLLFSAMIETALCSFGEPSWDPMRIDYALKQHEQWYYGDGLYGDGVHMRADYYNSFVIHPMLLDISEMMRGHYPDWDTLHERIGIRARRYAVILERLISPEGTFPAIGRSLAYRFGAFHLLAQIALRQDLPETMVPSQVRCALTAVMRRMMAMPGTFDDAGWLTIGFCGHQPTLGEPYPPAACICAPPRFYPWDYPRPTRSGREMLTGQRERSGAVERCRLIMRLKMMLCKQRRRKTVRCPLKPTPSQCGRLAFTAPSMPAQLPHKARHRSKIAQERSPAEKERRTPGAGRARV